MLISLSEESKQTQIQIHCRWFCYEKNPNKPKCKFVDANLVWVHNQIKSKHKILNANFIYENNQHLWHVYTQESLPNYIRASNFLGSNIHIIVAIRESNFSWPKYLYIDFLNSRLMTGHYKKTIKKKKKNMQSLCTNFKIAKFLANCCYAEDIYTERFCRKLVNWLTGFRKQPINWTKLVNQYHYLLYSTFVWKHILVIGFQENLSTDWQVLKSMSIT